MPPQVTKVRSVAPDIRTLERHAFLVERVQNRQENTTPPILFLSLSPSPSPSLSHHFLSLPFSPTQGAKCRNQATFHPSRQMSPRRLDSAAGPCDTGPRHPVADKCRMPRRSGPGTFAAQAAEQNGTQPQPYLSRTCRHVFPHRFAFSVPFFCLVSSVWYSRATTRREFAFLSALDKTPPTIRTPHKDTLPPENRSHPFSRE